MATLGTAWQIASSALEANQAALNITANNTANANSTSYTRQTANWQENSPVVIGGVAYGTGAKVTGPTSQRDRVLEQRIQQQTQVVSASGTRLSALESVQSIFSSAIAVSGASSDGIDSGLTGLFNAEASLEGNPTDATLRQQVLSAAQTLAESMRDAAGNLAQQRTSLDQQGTTLVSQANSLIQAIASLNQQISTTSPNGDAGGLEDQRQRAIGQLSQLIGIHQVQTENNGLTITTSAGTLLVSQAQSFQLTTGTVNGHANFFLGSTDITSQLASGGGQVGGIVQARDLDIPQMQAALDQLAYSVSTQVNTLNNQGKQFAGSPGTGNIFSQPIGVNGAAAQMSVVMSNAAGVATASISDGIAGNSIATAIANLQGSAFVHGDTPANYYATFVGALGSLVSSTNTGNAVQQASLTQLQSQRDSLSAVNLDEEASSLSTLERSYQAASKVFAILNTVIAAVINLGTETTVG
jgi:flagellar hook-associated protein 1